MIALISVFLAVLLPSNYLLSRMFQKAWPLNGHAFFILAALAFAAPLFADCSLPKNELKTLEKVTISRIIDGDSLQLSDGQQLRLIGVNTPEIRPAEPLAQEAKAYLKKLLPSGQAYLKRGEQQRDRYDRLLGHLFLEDGRNVESLILAQGFGFLVAIPPNTSLLSCQKTARDQARVNKSGVWVQAAYKAVKSQDVTLDNTGFARVSGLLQSVTQSRQHWWLQLDGSVVLRIAKKDQSVFDLNALKAMQGKRILASGWMVNRSNSSGVTKKNYSPFMLLLTHPVHIELL